MLPKVFLLFLIYSAKQGYKVDSANINIFTLKLKKSSLRSVSYPLLYNFKWQNWDLKPRSLIPEVQKAPHYTAPA